MLPDRTRIFEKNSSSIAATHDTLLNGVPLVLARLAWVIVTGLILILFIRAVPVEYADHYRSGIEEFSAALNQLGLSAGFFAVYRTALNQVEAVLFITAGIFIFSRKSDDWMVMLVSLACSSFVVLFLPTLITLSTNQPVYIVPVAFTRALGLVCSLIGLYYVFPDGRFVPGWLRLLAWLWVAMTLIWLIFPDAPANLVYLFSWVNDLPGSFLWYLIWFGGGVIAQIYRYRRVSNATQRQQSKWVVFGTTAAFLGFFLYYLLPAFFPEFRQAGVPRLLQILFGIPIYHLLILLVPITLATAILRFRLWDIDLIINRSLVYTSLSGLLVGLYFGIVLLLSLFFRKVTGKQQPEIVSILATLAIAFLFSPLRSWIQTVIDRRFYRSRYNAAQALATFGVILRDEVDLNRMSEHLQGMVKDTIQPAQISLWLNTLPTTALDETLDLENHPVLKGQGISLADSKNRDIKGDAPW